MGCHGVLQILTLASLAFSLCMSSSNGLCGNDAPSTSKPSNDEIAVLQVRVSASPSPSTEEEVGTLAMDVASPSLEGAKPPVVRVEKVESFSNASALKELRDIASEKDDALGDAVSKAEVAVTKHAAFKALTQLRADLLKAFDLIALNETGTMDEEQAAQHYRKMLEKKSALTQMAGRLDKSSKPFGDANETVEQTEEEKVGAHVNTEEYAEKATADAATYRALLRLRNATVTQFDIMAYNETKILDGLSNPHDFHEYLAKIGLQQISPFGDEETAKDLANQANKTKFRLMDIVDDAEGAIALQESFKQLSELRKATIKEFDTVAKNQIDSLDIWNKTHNFKDLLTTPSALLQVPDLEDSEKAQKLKDNSLVTQGKLVAALNEAEVAAVRHMVFEALIQLRKATIIEYDTIADEVATLQIGLRSANLHVAPKQHENTSYGCECKNDGSEFGSCGKWGTDYQWCYLTRYKADRCRTESSWDYCATWVNLGLSKETAREWQCKNNGSYGTDCGNHGKSYQWCYTDNGNWDYCVASDRAPVHRKTSYGCECREDGTESSFCGLHGNSEKSYRWCYLTDNPGPGCATTSDWDYCSFEKRLENETRYHVNPRYHETTHGGRCVHDGRDGGDCRNRGSPYTWCYTRRAKSIAKGGLWDFGDWDWCVKPHNIPREMPRPTK